MLVFTFKGGYCVVTDNINSLRKVTGFSITGNKPERGREGGEGKEGREKEMRTTSISMSFSPHYSKAMPHLRMYIR